MLRYEITVYENFDSIFTGFCQNDDWTVTSWNVANFFLVQLRHKFWRHDRFVVCFEVTNLKISRYKLLFCVPFDGLNIFLLSMMTAITWPAFKPQV